MSYRGVVFADRRPIRAIECLLPVEKPAIDFEFKVRSFGFLGVVDELQFKLSGLRPGFNLLTGIEWKIRVNFRDSFAIPRRIDLLNVSLVNDVSVTTGAPSSLVYSYFRARFVVRSRWLTARR